MKRRHRKKVVPNFSIEPYSKLTKQERNELLKLTFDPDKISGKKTTRIGINKTESTKSIHLIRAEGARMNPEIERRLYIKKIIFVFQATNIMASEGTYLLYSWKRRRRK